MLASSLQISRAFSTAGPVANGGDAWQTQNEGYGGQYAPKNLGEEYRRNIPVMFYAYDANFLGFFGPDGATAVDGAFALLNTNLMNLDAYSKSLSEVPLQTRDVNYTAQALGLIDLKSYTLGFMMLQLGLGNPIQYSWTLHDRFLPGGAQCPNYDYYVVQRNFDIVSSPTSQLQYSPYINDILYSYGITELCTQGVDLGMTAPFSVDPLAAPYSPIAASTANWGEYFTALTRDDVAGLRYLLTTNNINWELPASDVFTVTTNLLSQQLFPLSLSSTNGVLFNNQLYGTASYGDLVAFARTNDAQTVMNAFPTVQVTTVSNYFTTVTVANTVTYFTNYIGEPLGSPAHLVTNITYSTSIVQIFVNTFDNITSNILSTQTLSTILTTNIAPLTGAPLGSPLVTNVTTKFAFVNVPFGDFYTNNTCGLDIVSTVLTFTNYVTNFLSSASTTNNNTTPPQISSFTQIQIIPSISHVYSVHPVDCGETSPSPGLYQGVGGLRFVRADFDSLMGQFWQPVTNDYTMVLITNSKAVTQRFHRVVTQPDFLLTAADMDTSGGSGTPKTSQNVNFNSSVNANNRLAGPGTIDPVTTVFYNKGGPVYHNTPNGLMSGAAYFDLLPGGNLTDFFNQYFVWASFDGSTNTPVIFPNGTSIDDLQNQMLVQVSPTSLPFGIANAPYPLNGQVIFTASGGAFTAPFTWTNNDGVLSGLGLNLSPDGHLSGLPTRSGTFDFILTLTDVNARTVNFLYSITIQ